MPELPGAVAVIAELAARERDRVDQPHGLQLRRLRRATPPEARYVCHLFNDAAVLPPGPGPIGAALADDDVVVSLICDVTSTRLQSQFALRALGTARLNLVTRRIAALGVRRRRRPARAST